MDALTVAALQLAPARPASGVVDAATVAANLEHGAEMVRRCHEDTGATLVVAPESATTGFNPALGADALWDVVSDVPGPVTDPIAAVAAELGITVVWGTYERGPDRGVVYNTAVTIGPDGELLGTYRKTHLYVVEHVASGGWATPGDDVCVVDVPGARVGTTICFDGDFPELSRISALQGAEILVRPSAFLRSADIWELTTRARAYDNHAYVVAANAVGADAAGSLYFGNSLIVGPTAGVLARGTSQEGWVSATLDPDPLRTISPGSSVPQLFDHLDDRNLVLYRRHADLLGREGHASFPIAAAPGADEPDA